MQRARENKKMKNLIFFVKNGCMVAKICYTRRVVKINNSRKIEVMIVANKRQRKKQQKKQTMEKVKKFNEILDLDINLSRKEAPSIKILEKKVTEKISEQYGKGLSNVVRGKATARDYQKAVTALQKAVKKNDILSGQFYGKEKTAIKEDLKNGLGIDEIIEKMKNGDYVDTETRVELWNKKRDFKNRGKLKYTKEEMKQIDSIKKEIAKSNPKASKETIDQAAKAYLHFRKVKGLSKEEAMKKVNEDYLDDDTGRIKYI
jgi:hypothetical protein